MLPTFLPVLPLKRDHAGGKTCPVPTSIQGPEADKYSKGGVHTRKALLPVNTRADGPLFKPLVWLPATQQELPQAHKRNSGIDCAGTAQVFQKKGCTFA